MKKIFACLLLAVLSNALYGQKQANIWYFGDHAGLDFNFNPPFPLLNGQTYFRLPTYGWNEGCSSISDSSGSLLFYTDGENVWNKFNSVMPNGDSLKGHWSSTQSCIVVPKPNSDRLFYVFTTDALENNFQNGLRYSVVDMCLNSGMGDLVLAEKNIKLVDTVSEKLICIRHSNGNDYWIVAHKLNSNAFYSLKLTSLGIVDTVISLIGTQDSIGIGQIKATPNGQLIANATINGYDLWGGFHEGYTALYNFNSTTGIVSNEQILPSSTFAKTEYAVSFSPDNSKLYFSTIGHGEIYQYNMNAGNISAIIASKTNILNGPDSWRQMQLGPDGKLYISRTGKSYLSAIQYPDSLFPACNYIDSIIYLGGQYTSFGLPNFITGFDYSNTTVQCSTGIPQLNNSEHAIQVYPNPTISELNIQNNSSQIIQFTLYNPLGEKIIDRTLTNKTSTINLSAYSSGIYFYKVSNDLQLIKSGTIIKQ